MSQAMDKHQLHIPIPELLAATGGRLLAGRHDLVIEGVSIDSRAVASTDLFIPLRGSRADGHEFIDDALARGACAALVQQGRARTVAHGTMIEVADPLQALGDIAAYWRRRCGVKVVAITGSNGKTTTKEMVWNIISKQMPAVKNPKNFNNLIGLPLSLLQLTPRHALAVLEMGMSERGEIKRLAEICRPAVGLITNIGPSHLEQLGSLEQVQAAKAELFESLSSADTAIVNLDDARVAALQSITKATIMTYGRSAGHVHAADIRSGSLSSTAFDLVIGPHKAPVGLAVPGAHFLSNALGAAAIACALGVGIQAIREGLETFTGLPGRMEVITTGGITVINDSYNANPVSMQAALEALAAMPCRGRRVAVLGDMLELGSRSGQYHRESGAEAARRAIDYLFLIGDFAACVREGACAGGMPSPNIFIYDKLENLAPDLRQRINAGDLVLLKGSRRMGMEKLIGFLGAPARGNRVAE